MLKRKDLLGLINASAEEITEILDLAQDFKNRIKRGEKKMNHLDGKTVTVLFYENSTRTRTSFEQAAKYLGATWESGCQADWWKVCGMCSLRCCSCPPI